VAPNCGVISCANSCNIKTLRGYNAWLAQKVQLGLDSANAGKLIANADVEAAICGPSRSHSQLP